VVANGNEKAAKCETKLHGAIIPVVSVHEFFPRRGEIARLLRTASAQLVGHVLRDIPPLALGGIEGDDANRIAILPIEQVGDDGLDIRVLDVSLAPCLPIRAPKSSSTR
jgi:hypothetical protein